MYVTELRLSPHELARLLKLLVDHAYENPLIARVDDLVAAVARKYLLVLTDEHRDQIYGALSLVVPMPAGTTQGPDIGARLDLAIAIADVNRTSDVLGKAVFRAWQIITAAARQEPAEIWVAETGGLLKPDPRNEDLVDLSIAEAFFLVAHDKVDGRALLAEPVLACSIAAALLAELLLRDLIALDLATHRVQATDEPSESAHGLSAPMRQAFEVIQDGAPGTVESWLGALVPKGHLAVRSHLVKIGRVTRVEQGRFPKRVCYPPTGEIVDSVFRVATRPLAVERMPGPPYAVLVELAKAVHLTGVRYGDWVYAHHTDPGAALAEVPGRERFDLLLALTKAEVIDLLARP